jgi:TolB-like protein
MGRQAAPSRPSLSLAVLPLTNMTASIADDHFVDGVTEDLITDLSRISGAFITARNTSFTYKGKNVDVSQVGREPGVRYILEGGVRRGDGRVRVSAQLIDADTGTHVWADRFDIAAEDAYALQDEIRVTSDQPAQGLPYVLYKGRYYSIDDTSWDRTVFVLLNILFQTTIGKVENLGIPITIAK